MKFRGLSSVVSGECGCERTAPIKSRGHANLHVGEVPVTTRFCERPEGTRRTRGQDVGSRELLRWSVAAKVPARASLSAGTRTAPCRRMLDQRRRDQPLRLAFSAPNQISKVAGRLAAGHRLVIDAHERGQWSFLPYYYSQTKSGDNLRFVYNSAKNRWRCSQKIIGARPLPVYPPAIPRTQPAATAHRRSRSEIAPRRPAWGEPR